MIIRNSTSLLEQLSEVEENIRELEKLMDNLGLDVDREQLIAALLIKNLKN